ncbi:hypothetical protein [Burkholderia gladioli]|uniref:hypothetical protein n=1 Tax=Burkholderia gladioli TaxID=28095 RepID=UPI00163F1CD1|nr:hypothetical protein [Burkholderia gladioli]
MKKLRRVRQASGAVVACAWSVPVIASTGYILWGLVPFFRGDATTRIVPFLQAAAYFFARAYSGGPPGDPAFSLANFEKLNVIGWGMFYYWGTFFDLALAVLLLTIGSAAVPYLNRRAFALAIWIQQWGSK